MPPDTSRAERLLELRDVSKFFGDRSALRGIRLSIAPGDSVFVYGPNGAGKTTLLRTLAALARPSEGRVLFCGRDLHENPAAAKAQTGFASHASFLYGELTARENLKFTATLFGLAEGSKSVDAALELFALRERADEPVRGLSRGLQQRVSLARAFLHQPTFLLLDEPFTGLDRDSAAKLQGLLHDLPAQGKALVFSTHDFAQGAAIAQRLLALEAGQVRYDGPLSQAPLEALGIRPSAAGPHHA